MRVLVTGGAGYIGSVTAAQLVDVGHDVVVVDDLRSADARLVPTQARLVRADVGEPGEWADEVLDGVDACVHFAALIEAGESMRRPERFFANNTAGTLRLVEALMDAGVQRLVFSSTAAVYGQPESSPIHEDATTEPVNAYGASKLLVEQALAWIGDLRGLRYAVLRYFNASGATDERGELHDPESHLIPIVLDAAAGVRDGISIFGTDYDTPDGTCIRDYVHVADLADAHVRALEALTDHEQLVCNLGRGTGYSVRQVIDVAREVTGVHFPVTEAPRRVGDPARLVASADAAQRLLGWTAHRSDLHTIIESAWQWHQAQRI